MGVTTALLTVEEYAHGEVDAEIVERVKSNCIEILAGYIRQNPVWKPFSEGAPGLAFEAVSSSESASSVEQKIIVYRATGFRAIWIAYPRSRSLATMHQNGRGQHLHEGQYIEEPDLLPGFRVLVDRFFDGI
jgi:Uma2 family endonuclease